MPRRVFAFDSLLRTDWPWIVFDRDGHAQARGPTRLGVIVRHQRAEGWCHHRKFAMVKNLSTGEIWDRINGSWSRRAVPPAPPKRRAVPA